MSDGAPVCNLPNRGQVPALQAGRLFPTVPRATDLVSAIQALNALSRIIMSLAAPGLTPVQNNLVPFNDTSRRNLGGTPGISAAGQSGGSTMDGEDGAKAEAPEWYLTRKEAELVKIVNPEDKEQFVVTKRLTKLVFLDQASDNNATITFTMKPL